MLATEELKTNAFRDPVSVYKGNTDLNMVYVGNNMCDFEKQFAVKMSEVLGEDVV